MEFRKFSSIENSYRKAEVDRIVMDGHATLDVQWYALEKIHGANFSFWASEDGVKTAKRSGFIDPNENFYSSHVLEKKYSDKVQEMRKHFGAELLVIYGEICGGSGDGYRQVQTEVYYFDDIEFMAFDVFVDGKALSVSDGIDICNQFGIKYVPVISDGTFFEMINISPDFDSFVSGREDNKAEGTVVVSDMPLYTRTGRARLKNKSEAFSEKKSRNGKTVRVYKDLSEAQLEVIETLSSYITEARLRNVLSKFGTVTHKDFGKIMGEYAIDALEDAKKDEGRDFKADLEQEWTAVGKRFNNEISALIRTNLIAIINGEF